MTEVKKQLKDKLTYDEEGLRVSTPLIIANYKAERLKSKTIADLGSGIGIQALSFAAKSDRVIAVEYDVERFVALRKNKETMKLSNLELINGNALDSRVIREVGEVEIVHSDPSRVRTGDRWTFTNLSPNPKEIIESYRCDRMSFDLPAFFPGEMIPDDWEREYVSLSGELKRLSVYTYKAKTFTKSAISLPDKERIVEDRDLGRETDRVSRPSKWIYDLDGSLYYSGLIPEFLRKYPGLSLLHEDRQKTLLTGERFLTDSFLIKSYSVIDFVRSREELKENLKKAKAGKVVMRFPMDPSLYYAEKKNLEMGLEGDKTVFVFKFEDTFFLAERADATQERDEQKD